MDLQERWRVKEGYLLELMEDNEICLYHPGGERILCLNPTACLIWNLCNGETSVAEMIAALQSAYPDSILEIEQDVCDTLQRFLELDCLEPSCSKES